MHSREFDAFEYDYRVGPPSTLQEFDVEDRSYVKMWGDLTKKRIDALGYYGRSVTIFEVKQRVSMVALGQLVAYEFLYKRDVPGVNVSLVLVAAIDDPAVRLVLVERGIRVEIV